MLALTAEVRSQDCFKYVYALFTSNYMRSEPLVQQIAALSLSLIHI